jgi:hypothetical protein
MTSLFSENDKNNVVYNNYTRQKDLFSNWLCKTLGGQYLEQLTILSSSYFIIYKT